MRRALELAWDSARAGSLGIGAVITNAQGCIVATGRNRLAETDAGDDHLAGTSLAHAELNALAKLRWGTHGDDHLELWTTLEPCLQCAGAIRQAPIAEVHVLAPDPVFRDLSGVQAASAHLRGAWPEYHLHPADPFAVFGLLLTMHTFVFWGVDDHPWAHALPDITARARELHAAGTLIALAAEDATLDEALDALWPQLLTAVADVERCWAL
jgi:tRNA(adenine34) deaminase